MPKLTFWFEFASTYSYLYPAVKARLKHNTNVAKSLGIFGAPSFTADDGELFWGDDRLEQAVARARRL